MPKPKSQSLLWPIAAALAARGAIIIEDFSGPVDAFFLDDGSAAGLPSSGNSALEGVTLPHALAYVAEDALPTSLKAVSLEPGTRRGRKSIRGRESRT